MDEAIIQKYCRVCTKRQTHMISIFEHYEFSQCNLQVFEVIANCASVQIRKFDGFPEQICNECLGHLRQAFSFKRLCEDSDYKFQHNLVLKDSIADGHCIEVIKIECCHDNDNTFNEELDCASSGDGFKIKSEFCEDETKFRCGIVGRELDEENVIKPTTHSTVQNLKNVASQNSNIYSTKVKDEINGNDGKEVVSNVDLFEIKREFYEEDTKIHYGDLTALNANKSSTSTLQSLNDELSACSWRTNGEDIIEYGVSGKRLQVSDIRKSSTDSTTLQDVNNELSAQTKPIGGLQICEINLNVDHVSEDTEVSFTEVGNDINTNISKDVAPKTKNFTKKTEHYGISNKQLSQEGNVKKSSSHYLNDSLGETTPTISLNTNIKIHSEDKPYKCEICHKNFRLKQGLSFHNRIHTGDKPYQCEICNRRFNKKSNLKTHLKIHSEDKPYKCEICHKDFRLKQGLDYHTRIHTGDKPFQCEICSKSFSQKSSLNTHVKIHSGDEKFKCEICHKNFASKNGLNYHIRIHTGYKPYKCDICNSSFSLKRSLHTHVKIHTK